jgi:hypothetical protein
MGIKTQTETGSGSGKQKNAYCKPRDFFHGFLG